MDKVDKYQVFCNYLKDEYINRLSGESEEDEYIIGERPSDRIIIGLLDSGDLDDSSKRYESMHLLKVNFFLNKKAKGFLHLNIKGNLFYNVLPDYKDQISDKKPEDTNEDKQERVTKIVNRFKRIKIDNELKQIVKKDILWGRKMISMFYLIGHLLNLVKVMKMYLVVNQKKKSI